MVEKKTTVVDCRKYKGKIVKSFEYDNNFLLISQSKMFKNYEFYKIKFAIGAYENEFHGFHGFHTEVIHENICTIYFGTSKLLKLLDLTNWSPSGQF